MILLFGDPIAYDRKVTLTVFYSIFIIRATTIRVQIFYTRNSTQPVLCAWYTFLCFSISNSEEIL